MKRKTILLGALALVLVLCVSIGAAWAYFTTYASAQGGYVIQQGVEFEETFYDWTKHVVITSKPNTVPVYVRVRAYASTQYTLETGGAGWTQDGDWWYCTEILEGGGQTNPLDILILDVPTEVENGDSFNVVVVYEYAPVRYGADNNPLPYNSDTVWHSYTPSTEGGES